MRALPYFYLHVLEMSQSRKVQNWLSHTGQQISGTLQTSIILSKYLRIPSCAHDILRRDCSCDYRCLLLLASCLETPEPAEGRPLCCYCSLRRRRGGWRSRACWRSGRRGSGAGTGGTGRWRRGRKRAPAPRPLRGVLRLRRRVRRHHLRGERRWRVGRHSAAASCACGWPAGITGRAEGLGGGTVTE